MTANYPKQRPDLFWFVVLCVILSLLLSSCSPNFYCKRCPSITKDSIFIKETDSVVVHDTILKFKSDTAIIHDTVPCGDFIKEFHSGRASIKVKVKDSILTAECICDGIEAKLRYYEYFHKQILKSYHTEQRTAFVKKKTGFGRFKDWWFWISSILLALGITRFILKTYTKLQIPF